MDITRVPVAVAAPVTVAAPVEDTVKVVADGTVTVVKASAALPAFKAPAILPPDKVAAVLEAIVLDTNVRVDAPVTAKVPAQS